MPTSADDGGHPRTHAFKPPGWVLGTAGHVLPLPFLQGVSLCGAVHLGGTSHA